MKINSNDINIYLLIWGMDSHSDTVVNAYSICIDRPEAFRVRAESVKGVQPIRVDASADEICFLLLRNLPGELGGTMNDEDANGLQPGPDDFQFYAAFPTALKLHGSTYELVEGVAASQKLQEQPISTTDRALNVFFRSEALLEPKSHEEKDQDVEETQGQTTRKIRSAAYPSNNPRSNFSAPAADSFYPRVELVTPEEESHFRELLQRLSHTFDRAVFESFFWTSPSTTDFFNEALFASDFQQHQREEEGEVRVGALSEQAVESLEQDAQRAKQWSVAANDYEELFFTSARGGSEDRAEHGADFCQFEYIAQEASISSVSSTHGRCNATFKIQKKNKIIYFLKKGILLCIAFDGKYFSIYNIPWTKPHVHTINMYILLPPCSYASMLVIGGLALSVGATAHAAAPPPRAGRPHPRVCLSSLPSRCARR